VEKYIYNDCVTTRSAKLSCHRCIKSKYGNTKTYLVYLHVKKGQFVVHSRSGVFHIIANRGLRKAVGKTMY